MQRQENTGYEQVMGVHEIGRMTENCLQISVHKAVWLLGAVFSKTGAFMKQCGDCVLM